MLLDTSTWVGAGEKGHKATATLLRRAGWRVLSVPHGTTLPSVWPQAAARYGRAEVPA